MDNHSYVKRALEFAASRNLGESGAVMENHGIFYAIVIELSIDRDAWVSTIVIADLVDANEIYSRWCPPRLQSIYLQ